MTTRGQQHPCALKNETSANQIRPKIVKALPAKVAAAPIISGGRWSREKIHRLKTATKTMLKVATVPRDGGAALSPKQSPYSHRGLELI